MDHEPERPFQGIAEDLEACAAYLGAYLEDHDAPGIAHPAAEWRRTLLYLVLDIRDRTKEPNGSPEERK